MDDLTSTKCVGAANDLTMEYKGSGIAGAGPGAGPPAGRSPAGGAGGWVTHRAQIKPPSPPAINPRCGASPAASSDTLYSRSSRGRKTR
ncbi:MAG: hypothetical protein K2O83_13180, partial [Schaedlerella arabinosiphila]|nr:hypothetical protein [Schaedlerella arabinosiphila]